MRRSVPVLVLLWVLLAACSVGRQTTGTIQGVVTDDSSTPLPGVTVTLTAADVSRTAVTDVNGRYEFNDVSRGRYEVHADLAGFKDQRARVKLAAAKSADLHTKLRQSNVSEAITVTAEAVVNGVVSGAAPATLPPPPPRADVVSDAQYASTAEHDFIDASKQAVTTFAIDVDRASYANVRRFLNANQTPPPAAVRIEEMLNYFTYSYPQPVSRHPFSITTEVASCPWNAGHRLLRIGIQGRNLEEWRMAPNNLVFLLDVSGSMQPPERLPLLKSAFRLLVDELRAEDRVAIVVYAGASGLVLPSTSGADKQTIVAALDKLNAGGSTAGAAGIELAYEVAKANFIAGGNNRVILATDGDFNVGITRNEDLLKLIEQKRDDGIYMTTLGVGDDNYQDARMELLADHGNGNYAYLDTIKEAEKVFVHELTGTLVTIAKDVKVQLEFDRARVASYRQIGYEDRALANEDFDDDRKDAGELGAGHSVTALYEIVPAGNTRGAIAVLKLRYKQPSARTSELLTAAANDGGRNIFESSPDFQFAAAVAEWGMLLRKSQHKGTATYADALALARASRGVDLDGTREELLRLLEASRALSGEAAPAIAVK